MAPAYTVRARVIDIRTDTPRPTDRVLVDTNVWAWEYSLGSQVTPSGAPVVQVAEYRPYLKAMRSNGATRCRVVTALAELAHVIEQNELAHYAAGVGSLSLKEYRHNGPSERSRIVALIQRAWGLVERDSVLLPLTLDDALAASAAVRLGAAPVDGYDLFLLEAMHAANVTQLLSDDGDFCCLGGVELLTANPRVLSAARTQGRLAVR